MRTMLVDGVTIQYVLARNVSANRANPHRLTATCACGQPFMQHACGENTVRNLNTVITLALRQHKASGYCLTGE